MDWQRIYTATDYRVEDGDTCFLIKIGQQHPGLDSYLSRHAADSWGFITAWNPFSEPLSESENYLLNEALLEKISTMGMTARKGVGGSGDWKEESFFVFPISRETVLALGREFSQNAVLYAECGGKVELIWC